MKKLIGTAVLAALVATSAFAEISLGAWVRTLVVPVAGDGDEIYTGMTNSWGGGIRPARLDVRGTSEDGKVGMMLDFFANNGGVEIGDYCAGWFAPAEWVKFTVGKIDSGYTLRSDLTFGAWNWLRPGNMCQGGETVYEDEGITFNMGGGTGMEIDLFPVEGLQISALLSCWDWGNKKGNEAWRRFGNSWAAVAYTIADVGTIKVGFNGKAGEHNGGDGYGALQAAFDLRAVENLYITIGVREINFYEEYADGDIRLLPAIGASYQILDNFKVSAHFGVAVYEEDDPSFQFGVGIDFGITDTISLSADFRGVIPGDNADGTSVDPMFSFLVGVDWNFSSNGQIGIGFQGATGGAGLCRDTSWNVTMNHGDDFAWAVPIKFGYWF